MEAAALGLRIAGFYGALFLVYGVSLPYLPVLLDARGLDAAEIGLISSVPLTVRLVLTPAVAVHADRSGDHRTVVIGLAVIALAAIACVAMARGFWLLLLTVAAFQISLQSIMPLIETISMAQVKARGLDYGRMRLVGSITFIVATFAGAAVIDRIGIGAIAMLLIIATASTLAAALLLPRPERSGTASRPGLDTAALVSLARSPTVLLFLLAAGAVQSAHAVFYTFGTLHWRTLGLSSETIGMLWSLGVIAEIGLFWWSAAVLRWLSPTGLVVLGAVAALIRWALMALDPVLPWLIPLQILHGLTYGASHLGAMHFIRARVTDDQAGTVQALYATVTGGIGMGAAMIVAGYAYRNYAGASYLAMALLGTVGLVAAMALRRQARREDPLA